MNFGFRLYFEDKTEYVPMSALTCVTEGNVNVYRGKVDHVAIKWCFEQIEKGTVVTLTAESDRPLGALRDDVISPGGTTSRGCMALAENGFSACVAKAVIKAAERSKELGKH